MEGVIVQMHGILVIVVLVNANVAGWPCHTVSGTARSKGRPLIIQSYFTVVEDS